MPDIKKTILSYDRFVPYKLLELLNIKDITDIKLGDQIERSISILFTDIRDFTSLSERLTPEENFNFINAYNLRMGPIIQDNNGFDTEGGTETSYLKRCLWEAYRQSRRSLPSIHLHDWALPGGGS